MALVLDIFVYLPLLLMAVYGVCTRKARYDNTPSDKVENEEVNVKAEQARIGRQLEDVGTEDPDTLQVFNLVKQYKKPDPHPQDDSPETDRPLDEDE